jgi:RimJ/RimL family protein N-acetyltransferase
MSYVIKYACADDIPSIISLMDGGIRQWSGEAFRKVEVWHRMACTVEAVTSKLRVCGEGFLVAYNADSSIIGTIFVEPITEKLCHSGGLYLSKEEQGRGLGTLLLQEAIAYASRNNYEEMDCEIYEHNVPSLSLVRKLGAELTYSKTFDSIVYQRYVFNLVS